VGRTDTSVAEALVRAHAALLADVRELEQAVGPSAREGVAELRARLGATQAHVTEHFRFEEQNGYLDAVRRREPRLERTIQQLAEEHRQLARSLEVLVEQATAAASLNDPFRKEVRGWVERLRQHEVRENDLVQDAFNLDIGAED
jgi:DNA-binding transcriptional ArsR family regulator